MRSFREKFEYRFKKTQWELGWWLLISRSILKGIRQGKNAQFIGSFWIYPKRRTRNFSSVFKKRNEISC